MFGIAFLELVKKTKKVIILSLLIGVVMFIGVLLLSTYLLQSAPYKPYNNFFTSNGHLVSLSRPVIPENDDGYDSFVSGITKLKNIDYPICTTVSIAQVTPSIEIYGYDRCQEKYKPLLAEGKWYTETKIEGCLSAVITYDVGNIGVGDVVEVENEIGKECIYITGRLAKGARIYKVTGCMKNPSVFDIYDNEYDRCERILMSKEDVYKIGGEYAPGVNVAISYKEDITQEELLANEKYFNAYGLYFIDNAKDFCEKSEDIIVSKLMNVLPVGVAAFFFITIAIICIVSLDTLADIKDEAIMYICGISEGQYAIITVIKGVIMSVLGFSIMILGNMFIAKKIMGELLIFEMALPQIMICFGIMVFYILIMLIIRAVILKKNAIISVLRKADI